MPAVDMDYLPNLRVGIKVDDKPLAQEDMDYFHSVRINQKLFEHNEIIMEIGFGGERFGSMIEEGSKYLGKEVEVSIYDFVEDAIAKKHKGYVSEFAIESNALILKAYSKDAKMSQGTNIRTFLNSTTQDIVTGLVGENGLTPVVDSSNSQNKDYFLQYNESDWDCLKRIAFLTGNIFYFDSEEEKLIFKPKTDQGNKVTLRYEDVEEASIQCKIGINDYISKSYNPSSHDKPGESKSTSSQADISHSLFDKSKSATNTVYGTKTNYYLDNYSDDLDGAHLTSKAMMKYQASEKVKITGTVLIPNVTLGTIINCDEVEALKEEVFISEISMVFEESSYSADFIGIPAGGLVKPELKNKRPMAQGLHVGLITDREDPEELGRVKVKLNLYEDVESFWARIVAMGAGSEIGSYYLPQVGDQVLVGFEHGDVNHPVVIGSLYNSQNKPSFATPGGKDEILLFKSKQGTELRVDETAGSESFFLTVKDGKGNFTMDAKTPGLVIEVANGEITLKTKDVTIEATNDIVMKASNNVKINGNNVEVGAQTNLKLTGGSKAEVSAVNAELKGSAGAKVQGGGTTDLTSSGMMKIQGAVVKIN